MHGCPLPLPTLRMALRESAKGILQGVDVVRAVVHSSPPMTSAIMLARLYSAWLSEKVPLNEVFYVRPTDEFLKWLADILPAIPIRLHIKHSRYVPGGIDQQCLGVEAVLSCYHWQACWTDANNVMHRSGDWPSTERSLAELRSWLVDAIQQTSSENEFLRSL